MKRQTDRQCDSYISQNCVRGPSKTAKWSDENRQIMLENLTNNLYNVERCIGESMDSRDTVDMYNVCE